MASLIVKTVAIVTLLVIIACYFHPVQAQNVSIWTDKYYFNPNTGPVKITYTLATALLNPYIAIISEGGSGNVVDAINPVDGSVGTHSVTWSGIDKNGYAFPDGMYQIYFYEWTVNAVGTMESSTIQAAALPYTYVVVDTVRPVTTCSLSGTSSGSNNFTSAVTITLSASDQGSGIKNNSYALDYFLAGHWSTYNGPITVTNNGNRFILYWSTDNAGNIETTRRIDFRVAIPTPTPTPTPTPMPPTPTPTPTPTAGPTAGLSGPKADFSASPTSGVKPLTVNFNDHSTGPSLTYTWDFGDGTSNERNPTHVYQNAGTYTIALRVTNAEGTDQKIIPAYITVTEPGQSQQNNGGTGGGQSSGGGGGVPANGTLVLSVTMDPSTVDKDKTTVITVAVKDQNNTSVQDAKVLLTAPEGVTLIPASGLTNESGVCQFSFNSPNYGNYTLNAIAVKQGYTNGSYQTKVVLSGNDMSYLWRIMPIVFVIALLILLLLIALFLLLRRTRVKLELEETAMPADGKATMPVTVTLVNGLGRPKKMKKKAKVAMGATAGTIGDITIPPGSNSAEAVLISSKEFGPVTVTANYGNKTAMAKVDFKYSQASLDVIATPPEIPADGTSTSTVTIKVKNEAGDYIAPLEENIVELRTTLGRVQSPVKLPPKAQSVNAVLTAGDVGGTAVITAFMGTAKGETNVSLKGTPKRFCMHCGSSMTMEASKCPKCGLIPPSGVDVKQCTTCNAVVPESARYCDKCGAKQPEKLAPPTPQPPAQEPKKG